ncbi:unnamed protein product [Leptosia nina]|uniref:Malonyl-CoA:ACP transacylase (MAT) domain-containing protein n=1 Tax=Leptosia nina TaxID=320188 RepID=A0AAV1J8M3_9NEOP
MLSSFSVKVRSLVPSTIRWASQDDSPLRRLVRDASLFGEGKEEEGELAWATQPYAVSTSQEPTSRTDPKDTTVLLFPGQGSQHIGMGKCLDQVPAAMELYEFASSVVGWDVAKLCRYGPEEKLSKHCQIAVLVTSLGALELARERRRGAVERVRAAAGFSLGEITALVFGGALPFERALRLVEVRETAMQAAAKARPGGMLTVWLAPEAKVPALLRAARDQATSPHLPNPVCEVANYLYPGCKVLAGDEEALKWVEREGRSWGVRRAARIRVSGAFHTILMAQAEAAVREALSHCELSTPRVPVVSCVDARTVTNASAARRRLERLTAAPVRWEQVLHALYARPADTPQPYTLTLGPGNALRSTLKQVNARAWDASTHIDV